MIKIINERAGLRSANFYPSNWDEGCKLPDSYGYGINRDENIVVYHRWGNHENGYLERFYIILNFNDGKPGEYKTVSFNVAKDGDWINLLSPATVPAYLSDGKHRITVNVPCNYGTIYYQKG